MSKFKDIYPTYEVFKMDVIDIINIQENRPYYINDEDFSFSQDNIYSQLMNVFKNYDHVMVSDEEFKNSFAYVYSEKMLSLYTKITYFKTQEMEKITSDFYKTISSSSALSSSIGDTVEDKMFSQSPNNKVWNDILDDLNINEADRAKTNNILKNDSTALSSIENKYRLFKQNEASEFKSLIMIFLNSFAYLFASIGDDSERDSDINQDYVFLNGYVVRQVPYLGVIHSREINDLTDGYFALLERIKEFGVPKKVYDTETNDYKYLSEFTANYFGGLSEQQIDYRIYSSGVIWQPQFNYGAGFKSFAIDKSGIMYNIISLIDDNIGNEPFASPDAWYIAPNTAVDIEYVIKALTIILDDMIANLPQVGVGSGLVIENDILSIDPIYTSGVNARFDAQDKAFKDGQDAQDKTLAQLNSYHSKIENSIIKDGRREIIGFKSYSEFGSFVEDIRCNGNKITLLNLTNNTSLTNLECSLNQLTSLDLTNNTSLTNLECSLNQLTNLDLTNNTYLRYLSCDSNQLTSLDLTNNTDLKRLYCRDNPNLKTVKISQTLQGTIDIEKDNTTTIEWV